MIKIIEKLLLVALLIVVSASYAETAQPANTVQINPDSQQVEVDASQQHKQSIQAVKYVRNITSPNGFGESVIINDAAFYPKSADVKADSGDKLEYAIVVTATNGDLEGMSIKEVIPAYAEYVPDSTRLNNLEIADRAGQCPLVEAMLINDPGSVLHSGVIKAGSSAVVMYRVRVNLMLDLPENP